MAKKKRRYVSPGDRVEKLTLIGTMGYISANEDRLLAAVMWDGGGGRRSSRRRYTPT